MAYEHVVPKELNEAHIRNFLLTMIEERNVSVSYIDQSFSAFAYGFGELV